jgi:hypothetical protein
MFTLLSFLYILHVNPLLDEWLTKIFSHYVGYLFTLLVHFLFRSFLICYDPFFNSLYYFLSYHSPIQKSLPMPTLWSVSPLFFSNSFKFLFKNFAPFWKSEWQLLKKCLKKLKSGLTISLLSLCLKESKVASSRNMYTSVFIVANSQ